MIFPHLLLKENAAIINKTMLALIRVLEHHNNHDFPSLIVKRECSH